MSQKDHVYIAISNIKATFEVQFIKKLSNTKAELKELLLRKKKCVKGIPCSLNIFTWKNKRSYVYLPVPYN